MVQTGVDQAGFTFGRDLVHSQSREAAQENMCHRVQNDKTNVKKQQQQKKKTEEEENHHWQKNRREPANRRGWRQTKPTSWKGARGNRKEEGKKQVSKTLNVSMRSDVQPKIFSVLCVQFDR